MKKTIICTLIICTFLFFINSGTIAQNATIDTSFNSIDNGSNIINPFGKIYKSVIQSDGKIIICGDFDDVSANVGVYSSKNICRLDTTGHVDTSFNVETGFWGDVFALSIQSDGKIIVGGSFLQFNNYSCNRIARLNNDGSFDTTFNIGLGFDNGANIYKICSIGIQTDGKIVLGGLFTNYNGVSRNNIIRLNNNGSLDSTFNIGTGFDSQVNTICFQPDNKIIAGGYFTNYNGISRKKIVRLNTDGTIDYSFNPGSGFGTIYNYSNINAIDIYNNGKIIAGGEFTTYNGLSKKNIILLNADGSCDASFNTANTINQKVNTVIIQTDGKIIVGGESILKRLNTNGSIDTSFNTGNNVYSDEVLTTSIQPDGKIIVGGDFLRFNNTRRHNLLRINSNASVDTAFIVQRGFDDVVYTTNIQNDGKIIVGGDFLTYNGIKSLYLARLNPDGSLDNTFSSGNSFTSPYYNGFVKSTYIQPDGKILVGGNFNSYNGNNTYYLVRLNSNGTIDSNFNSGIGFGHLVNSICVQQNGKIIVAGTGGYGAGITRLNNDGTKDLSFSSGYGFNNEVSVVRIQSDGKIIVGGWFTTYNGLTQKYLVRLNSNGSVDNTFNVGTALDYCVTAIFIQLNGKIIIGGKFTSFNGITRNGILRLNIDGSLDTSFDPGFGFYSSNDVSSIIQSNNKFVLGGTFNKYNNKTVKNIVRINNNGSIDNTFNFSSGINGRIFTMSYLPNGQIIVGGSFGEKTAFMKNNILRLNNCLASYSPALNISVCNSYTLNGQTYTTSGTYTQTLVNSVGCDSIITLNLTVLNSVNTITTTACNSFTLNGQTYTTSGTYIQTLTNSAACDSIITLNLTITNPTTYTFSQTACNSFTLNGQTYTTSGTYTQTLTNTAGCDSIITLNLTINKVTDISTSVSGVTITSNNNSASYQWLNCDNNFAPISGAIGQSFTASSNGNYAVQLTQNGCLDTSACVAITTVGITNPSTSESLNIYPNPAKENLIIELIESNISEKTSISIYNIQGQLCRQIISNQSKTEIDIKDLSAGLYLVKVNNENESFVSRFVKE